MSGALRRVSRSILVATGLPSAFGSLSDSSALLQASLSSDAARGAGVEAAWEALRKEKLREEGRLSDLRSEALVLPPLELNGWPGLGDIWGDVKEGAGNLTDRVGDIMRDPASQAPSIQSDYSDELRMISKALTDSLEVIKLELDSLLNDTLEDRASVTKEMGWFMKSDLAVLLPRFESTMDDLLGSAHGRWSLVQDSIDRSVSSVAGGLEAAHQRPLGSNLRLNIQVAQRKLDNFLRDISDAKQQVQGAGNLPLGTVGDRLLVMNAKLNEALQFQAHFVMLLQQAFMDLVDTISNAVLWSSGDVNALFGTVQHGITDVAWRARSASRELILGSRSALKAVAHRVGVELPPWEPVSIPLLQSSAPSRGGFLVLALCLSVVSGRL